MLKYILIILIGVSNEFEPLNYASNTWTKLEDFEEGELPPLHYDSHRCGLPLHVDNDNNFVSRYKRFRPHNYHHRHNHHFNYKNSSFRHLNETHYHHDEHIHRKVMGGHGVEEGQLPWAVAIHKHLDGYDGYACTGTLISRRHVLTAAHCFFKYGKLLKRDEVECHNTHCCYSYEQSAIPETDVHNYITVYIGSNCLINSNVVFGECNSKTHQQRFRILKAKYSQYFDAKCLHYDYAIIELEEDVPADIANHICLLNLHENTKNIDWQVNAYPVLAYGWGPDPGTQECHGKNKRGGCLLYAHSQLHLLKLPGIWTDQQCLNQVSKFGNYLDLTRIYDLICTMETFTEGFCNGDSGGGVIAQFSDDSYGRTKRWFIVGIISFGTGCISLFRGSPPKAQAHVSVPYHSEEITEWLNGNLFPQSEQLSFNEDSEQFEIVSFKSQEIEKCK
uniref:Peptidase S1 domain-containing protein n=1 Tax=Meloidogyne incognita TaxID=6306 RepID=A0A914MXK9_MELIC